MKIEIDQSGRFEYTSHDTVIAFSNNKKAAILIKAKDKRSLQKIFRETDRKHILVIRGFALLIFLLLKKEKIKEIQEIVIDTEYTGWEAQVKNYLVADFRRLGVEIDPESISFQKIGKKSEAHWHAYRVFKKERKPEIIVGVKEMLNELFR